MFIVQVQFWLRVCSWPLIYMMIAWHVTLIVSSTRYPGVPFMLFRSKRLVFTFAACRLPRAAENPWFTAFPTPSKVGKLSLFLWASMFFNMVLDLLWFTVVFFGLTQVPHLCLGFLNRSKFWKPLLQTNWRVHFIRHVRLGGLLLTWVWLKKWCISKHNVCYSKKRSQTTWFYLGRAFIFINIKLKHAFLQLCP